MGDMVDMTLAGTVFFPVTRLVRRVNLKKILAAFEKEVITAYLRENKGNQTKTAKELGVHRNTLTNKMKKHKIC